MLGPERRGGPRAPTGRPAGLDVLAGAQVVLREVPRTRMEPRAGVRAAALAEARARRRRRRRRERGAPRSWPVESASACASPSVAACWRSASRYSRRLPEPPAGPADARRDAVERAQRRRVGLARVRGARACVARASASARAGARAWHRYAAMSPCASSSRVGKENVLGGGNVLSLACASSRRRRRAPRARAAAGRSRRRARAAAGGAEGGARARAGQRARRAREEIENARARRPRLVHHLLAEQPLERGHLVERAARCGARPREPGRARRADRHQRAHAPVGRLHVARELRSGYLRAEKGGTKQIRVPQNETRARAVATRARK